MIGVCKAYTTRVGSGPFPTGDEGLSDYLHGLGREFGATTGRPRGCGWLDTVLLRFACMVNGVTGLAVTNVDGLDAYETLQICTGYDIDGEIHTLPPADRVVMGPRRARLRNLARLAVRHHRLHQLRATPGARESLSQPPRPNSVARPSPLSAWARTASRRWWSHNILIGPMGPRVLYRHAQLP